MNNSTQFLNMIKNIKNPKQAVINMMRNNNNPILNNLIQMAENGDDKGVEQFARNLYKQQGRDFDQEISQLKNYFN